MPVRDRKVGERLRKLRQRARLTFQDAEALSSELALIRHDPRLRVSKARLSALHE